MRDGNTRLGVAVGIHIDIYGSMMYTGFMRPISSWLKPEPGKLAEPEDFIFDGRFSPSQTYQSARFEKSPWVIIGMRIKEDKGNFGTGMLG